MAGTGSITSTGLGSGLDIESLVTKLMGIQKAPITLLEKKESSYQTKLSAWGQVKGALSSLESATSNLKTSATLLSYTASVANSSVASATAKSTASAASYSLEVSSLARAQKIQSGGYTSADAAVSMGTLTISTGTTSTNIEIDTTNNTLTGVMKAINSSDSGMTASIVNDGEQYRMIVSSSETGSANSFSMSGITEFSYTPGSTTGAMSTIYSAKNASFTVDGVPYSRSSNTVSDVISGVTLGLTAENPGSPTQIIVKPDTDNLSEKIKTLISSYNSVISLISTETAYNKDTGEAGDLNGDSGVSRIKSQLRGTLSEAVSGGEISRLYELGIKINVDGTLTIENQKKFNSVLETSPEDVATLFGGKGATSGLADNMYSKVHEYMSSDGVVSKRISAMNKSISDIKSKIDVLDNRMSIIEETYRMKFSALDKMVSSMNSTSDFLKNALNSNSDSNN